ncbi:MAG: hypothetical protein KF715_19870 [Candidatus Didemnitutus sp.]|nr:hypothetical protein [Candidatus Didemnitutus sp.]
MEKLAAERAALGIDDCRRARATAHRASVYLPTGGSVRAPVSHLAELAERLTEIAMRHGYPHEQARNTDADAEWSECLHRFLRLTPHQAAHEGMWHFMTLVLVPDLVRWRWGTSRGPDASDRWITTRHRQRNTFGRLWWRCAVLHEAGAPAPYHRIHALGEDELVQLMERTSLSGNRRLAGVTADLLLETTRANPDVNRATLLRDQQKRILRLGAFMEFQAAGDEELRALVRETFGQSVRALRGEIAPLASIRSGRAAREDAVDQRAEA